MIWVIMKSLMWYACISSKHEMLEEGGAKWDWCWTCF